MTNWKKVPETIAKHRDAQVWGPIWSEAHNKDCMAVIVVCGKPGIGKTNVMASIGNLLDRDSDDVPRFDPPNMMCYKPSEFTGKIQQIDFPEGRVLCLDDAELVLYNKEALSKVAIEIGKILASMRYKNFIVIMTLPHFKKLEAHARSYADYFIEVVDRDEDTKQNIVKIQKLETNAYSGEIYRHNLVVDRAVEDPLFGIPIIHKVKALFRIDRVRPELEKIYKAHEHAQKDKSIQTGHKKVKVVEEGMQEKSKNTKITFEEIYTLIKSRIKEVLNKRNKVDMGKIMLLKGEDGNLLGIGMTAARSLASMLNEELGLGN